MVAFGQVDRTGFRLEGPDWRFTQKAYNKPKEHGSSPSNIIDHGYPMGAINLAGQTPIILVNDGPSMGGFINPYTVPSAAFWKLGQAKPGERFHFKLVSIDEAQIMAMTALCTPEILPTHSTKEKTPSWQRNGFWRLFRASFSATFTGRGSVQGSWR